MKVIAKSTIKHNGQYYEVGQALPEMSESEVSKLLAAGSVRVEGASIRPEEPEDARTTPSDKTLESKGEAATANLPIAMTMKKTVLIGIARANGLQVDKTATPGEVYKMIKEFRAKNNIEVEEAKVAEKPEDEKAKAAREALEAEEKAAAEEKAKADEEAAAAKEKEEAEAKAKEDAANESATPGAKTPKSK